MLIEITIRSAKPREALYIEFFVYKHFLSKQKRVLHHYLVYGTESESQLDPKSGNG